MEAARRHSQRVLTQQSLMMPHKVNGEVDWMTLGNILKSNIIEEVLYGSYIDVKHRSSRPNFTVDTDWKFSYEEDGVVVLQKHFADSPFHCWMGRAVLDFPLQEIASFIADPASAPVFDKYIKESRPVEVISQSDIQTDSVAYYRTEAKHCLVKKERDFLFYVRYAHFDYKYIQTALSVEHPLCPPIAGVVRAQIQPGSGWHLEPYMGSSNRTLVSYVAHIDLVGLPPILSNRVLKRQPLNIVYVKKHLKTCQQQQQSHTFLPPSPSHTEDTSYTDSHRPFEDPLPVTAFTNHSVVRRTASNEN